MKPATRLQVAQPSCALYAVLASYPRSGQHWLCSLLIERLTGEKIDPADSGAINRRIPAVKAGWMRYVPALGITRTHSGPRPWYGPKVLLTRDAATVAASTLRYFGRVIEDKPPAWLEIPSQEAFNATWRAAGAMVIRYEDLLQGPAAGVDFVLEAFGL